MSREQAMELDESDVEFLAARVKRLCAHFGYPIPDKDDRFIVGVAASLIGAILTKLELEKRNTSDLDQQAKDAARYAWLRSQHESQEVHSDTEGFSRSEPAACAFTVFRPTRDESLEPVGCFPGELDEAIDAAIVERMIDTKDNSA